MTSTTVGFPFYPRRATEPIWCRADSDSGLCVAEAECEVLVSNGEWAPSCQYHADKYRPSDRRSLAP